MKKYDVFISHKSEDKDFLTALEKKLDEAGYTYWSDSKMISGIPWTNQINEAINESRVMIVLLSKNVLNDSANVEAEIYRAIRLKQEFLTINLDDTPIDDYDNGPIDLYLKKNQWIFANNDIEESFTVIDYSLKRLLTDEDAKKKELDVQIEIEAARLARIKSEEQEKRLQDRIMDGIIDNGIKTIKYYLSKGNYNKANESIENMLRTSNSWKIYEQKLICITKNYTKFDNYSEDLINHIKENAPKEEYEKISDVYTEKKKEHLEKINKDRLLREATERQKNLEGIKSLQNEITEKTLTIDKMQKHLDRNKTITIIKLIILFLISTIISFVLFTNYSRYYFLLCMIIVLLFGIVKKGFIRFILTILLFLLFGYCSKIFLFDQDGLLYSTINTQVLYLIQKFSFFNKINYINIVVTIELFLVIFYFSITCILLYNKIYSRKIRRYILSKALNLFAYFIISLVSSLLYLLYYETKLKDKFQMDCLILLIIIFAIPVIFSISQFKTSESNKNRRLIKYKTDKISNEILTNRNEIAKLNKKISN